jgi:hypothetical protein
VKKLMTVVFLAVLPCCWAQTPGSVNQQSADPATCSVGQIWYNSTNNVYKVCPMSGNAQSLIGVNGVMNPPLFGPPGASTNIALVDGTTYTDLAAAIGYFAGTSQQGGVVWDYDAFEDVATNPFPQNLAIKLFLGVGAHSSATNHPCGTTSVYCIVLEKPWVLPAGTQIHGSGRVNQFNDPSTGTMFTIGNTFPAPLGPSSMPTATCLNTGGSLGNGIFYFVVAQYNNVNTNGSGQATAGVGLHSSEFSCSGTGGGSGSVSIPPPATLLTNSIGSATEWLVYATAGFTGSVTTSAGATGGCPANCVIWSSGSNFAQGQPLDIVAGVPIVISSTTYHIQQIWNSTTLSTLETQSTNSTPATYTSSLGAWQQVCTNSSGSVCQTQNGTCSVANGSIDPTNCTIGSTVTVTGMSIGEPPLPVDTSNCMFYMGGGNSSTIIFDTFMENFSINLTNGDSLNQVASTAIQPTPYTNSPSCAFYVSTAQEESYLREFNISGASQQSYGVFANSAPNFSMEDAITGGGPNGYSGKVDCTAATPSVCTLHSGAASDPVGNWWGVSVNIASASTCPLGGGVLCVIATVNSPTQFTLTTAAGAGLTNKGFCIGSNQSGTACTGTGTINGGNFIPYIFDGTVNPSVSATGANGTARLMKNVSISSKSGAYNPYLVDIRGANASVLIAATHMEENPPTGNDCVYITAGGNVTVKGDKFACPNTTVHRDATAGQGSVENILNSSGALFEDDQITPGSGTGCGNNCWLKNPGSAASGSYSSYSNFTKAAAPIFTAWGFAKQGTPDPGNLQCVVSSQHVGDCASVGANARAAGIGLAPDGNMAQYQFAGLGLVNSSAAIIWTANDIVCSDSSSMAFSVDNGAGLICPAGTIPVGVVYMTDTVNTLTHQVVLRIGTPTPISSEMMTAAQNTLTTQTSLTNLSFPVLANRKYQMTCTLYVEVSAAATTGVNISVIGPASPTTVNVSLFDPNSAVVGGVKAFETSAFSTTIGGAVSTTSTTFFPITVTMGLNNGTTAGTVQLRAGAGGSGNVSIAADSFCNVTAQ